MTRIVEPDIVEPDSRSQKAPPTYLRDQPDGPLLAIKLQPRASKNEIGQPLGDELRIKVTAPPIDSAANEALLQLIADRLDCARRRLELLRGHTSRHKVVKIHGFSVATVLAKLNPRQTPDEIIEGNAVLRKV